MGRAGGLHFRFLRVTAGVAGGLALLTLVVVAGCGASEPASRPVPSSSGETAPATAEALALPELARIACDAETTDVLTPRVRPQRDGIHLRFENRAGKPLAYSVESRRGGGRGGGVDAQGTDAVVPLPPGPLAVACFDPEASDDPSEKERSEVEVVDPLGLWTPSVLSSTCKTAVATTADYASGAEGEGGAPFEVTRRFLERRGVLEDGDIVEAAGYPEQKEAIVRLARDGETLAVLEFMSDGEGGWLLSTVNACTGIGLGSAGGLTSRVDEPPPRPDDAGGGNESRRSPEPSRCGRADRRYARPAVALGNVLETTR